MTNLLFLLAISGIIIWVAKINHSLGTVKEKNKGLEHENRQLAEANKRFQRLIEKVEFNQVQSKKRVDAFVSSLNDAKHASDFNELLDEAFGSLVNRGDMGTE